MNDISQETEQTIAYFYQEGHLVEKNSEEIYINGSMEGCHTWWYRNGQKFWEVNFINGEQQGLWTKRYENGQKKEEGNMVNNKPEGEWQFWDENGLTLP